MGGEDDGRSTGGLSNRPPVPKPLSTKAFQEKTGGWEVKTLIRVFDLRLKNTFVRKQKEILISFVFRSLIRIFARKRNENYDTRGKDAY